MSKKRLKKKQIQHQQQKLQCMGGRQNSTAQSQQDTLLIVETAMKRMEAGWLRWWKEDVDLKNKLAIEAIVNARHDLRTSKASTVKGVLSILKCFTVSAAELVDAFVGADPNLSMEGSLEGSLECSVAEDEGE